MLSMRAKSTLLFRALTLEAIASVLVGLLLTEPLQYVAAQFDTEVNTWIEDTHYHSDLERVHLAVKHQSHEGHWLNIVCNLPGKTLDVSLKLKTPIEIIQGSSRRVNVVHRVGQGQHHRAWWNFNDKESLVFAPDDIGLAQRILRSKSFYFYGQFEEYGPAYVATFDLLYTEDIHPAIPVLTACDEGLMPLLETPTPTPPVDSENRVKPEAP